MPQWTTRIKQFLYPLYIYPKVSNSKKKFLDLLFEHLKETDHPEDLKVFSNQEEDGIILWLLASINCRKGFFIDVGSNDCINSNCANLAFNFSWTGVFIDADPGLLQIGEKNYRRFGMKTFRFIRKFLTPANTNAVLTKAAAAHEVDFMNIDIDGNDYAVWQSLQSLSPKIVLIETKIEFGAHDIVVNHANAIQGASLISMTNLATSKGYTLVATNKAGFNAFYVRNDFVQKYSLAPLSVTSVLNTPAIFSCFYSKDIMQPLLEMANTLKPL